MVCEYVLIINNDLIFETQVFDKLMQIAISEAVVSPYPQLSGARFGNAGGYFDDTNALLGNISVWAKLITKFDDYHAYAPTCFIIVNSGRNVGMMDERYLHIMMTLDFISCPYRRL